INVKVRPADRASCYFDDRVTRMLDSGIRDAFAAYVAFPVPGESFHCSLRWLNLKGRKWAPALADAHGDQMRPGRGLSPGGFSDRSLPVCVGSEPGSVCVLPSASCAACESSSPAALATFEIRSVTVSPDLVSSCRSASSVAVV